MTSFLSRLNPIPAFPPYPGPFQVGTVDVEVDSNTITPFSSTKPERAPATISYRIFYPCEKPTKPSKPVYWLPKPQRPNLLGLLKYLGRGDAVSNMMSLAMHPATHIVIPCHRNATVLQSSASVPAQFPVCLFSHGLAGNRNLYSYLNASLASHGVVVIAVDHRDGSSPIQYIRATPTSPASTVDSITLPHTLTPEVYAARDAQLRIRVWELSLIYKTLLDINAGQDIHNLDSNSISSTKSATPIDISSMLSSRLDLEPGRLILSGHSFGAATMVQFTKATFYSATIPDSSSSLFSAISNTSLTQQITTSTPLILLDPWMLPLTSPAQSSLWNSPLPCFSSPTASSSSRVLSIISEGFWNWKLNADKVIELLTPPTPSSTSDKAGEEKILPGKAYYAKGSKHFAQSDFGILFSWIVERFAKGAPGKELLHGNVNIIINMIKGWGYETVIPTTGDKNHQLKVKKADVKDKKEMEKDKNAGSNDGEKQVEQPVSQGMPNMMDEKVWIEIPVLDIKS